MLYFSKSDTLCWVRLVCLSAHSHATDLPSLFTSNHFRSDELGMMSRVSVLSLAATAPAWIRQPANQTVLDNNDATLRCQADGSPRPKTTWFKGPAYSTPIQQNQGRLQVLESGDLLIAAVRESDGGVYTCQQANEAGSLHASAMLAVLGKWSRRRD